MKLSLKLKKFSNRGVYFITAGDTQGAFATYISEASTKTHVAFLVMPDLKKVSMERSTAIEMLRSSQLEYVQTLPKKVYSVCFAQYSCLK